MPAEKKWFETWFNTHYHDVLYQHRDEEEASSFLHALVQFLHPPAGATILDAGCGKGRHATLLSEKGFEVTGIDLSYKNIQEARKMENEMLSFFQHDMRNTFRINYFDFIFNFYTSFGYFETKKEDLNTLIAFASGLKKGGYLVIDFFNINTVLQHLVEDESKEIEGIHFKTTKTFADGFVKKNIAINDHGKEFEYDEIVKGLSLADFEAYFHDTPLRIKAVFGNYNLAPFEPSTSERLIIIAEK